MGLVRGQGNKQREDKKKTFSGNIPDIREETGLRDRDKGNLYYAVNLENLSVGIISKCSNWICGSG